MNISEKEYQDILKKAKLIDPINFMDIAHDFILEGIPMGTAKFNYKTSNVLDYTKLEINDIACCKCNTVKPVSCFSIKQANGIKYLNNWCSECVREYHIAYHAIRKHTEKYKAYHRKYQNNKYANDPVYREKILANQKRYREKKKAEREKICNA